MDDDNEDKFEFSWYGQTNEEDDKFDTFVGCLQEIVISNEFESMQSSFFSKITECTLKTPKKIS